MKRLESNESQSNYNNDNWSEQNFSVRPGGSRKKSILFSHREVMASGFEGKFEIVFSDGMIDLSRMQIPLYNREMKIDVVFSNGKIRINEEIPAVISVKSVFSSVRLPDNSAVTFGGHDFVTRGYREGQPHLYIRIDSVFSSTEVFDIGNNFK